MMEGMPQGMPQEVPAMPMMQAVPMAMPMYVMPMMQGRPITTNVQNLGRAADAITQFKPGQKFWTPPQDLSAATAKGAGKVSRHLATLENTGAINFTGVRVSAATLKEYNTQINTVLQFVQAHGDSLPVNQGPTLQANMLNTKISLTMECLGRLNAGAPPEEAKQLCALLNQLLPELPPVATEQPNQVQLWKGIDQNIHTLGTQPELARLLGPSLKQCRANMLQINKAEALATPVTSNERTVAQVRQLQERQGKMRLEGGEIGMVPQERYTSRWATLKAKIAEFFGRVGRSSESQAAAEVLMADVHKAYLNEVTSEEGSTKLSTAEAAGFLTDIIKPLSTNKWFQGALKHNPALRQQFEDVKTDVLISVTEGMDQLIGNASVSENALQELADIKTRVSDLKACGGDQGRCNDLTRQITQRQQEITTDRLTQIAVDAVGTDELEALARLEEDISDLRAAAGADVFKECRRAEAQTLNAISNRRTELGNEEVHEIAEEIPTAMSNEDIADINHQLERIINDPICSPETKQLARQQLRALEARAQSVRSYNEGLEFLQHPQFNATDGRLLDRDGFLHHLENCVNFLSNETALTNPGPEERDFAANDALAIDLYSELVRQSNTAVIGHQLGGNGLARLRALGTQCHDLQARVRREREAPVLELPPGDE